MKKFSIYMLIAALALGTLAGCSGTTDSSSSDQELSSDASGTEEGAEDSASQNTSQSAFNAGDIEFEVTTVIENENFTVQITDLEVEDGEYIISVEMESESSDYTLYLDEISVEGLMYDADTYWGELGTSSYSVRLIGDVSPGTTESGSIVIYTEVFEEVGITDFTDIMMTFSVKDYYYDVVEEETVHIYPHGQENAQVYTRDTLDTDVVLADTDEAALTVTGYEDEESGDFTAVLYLQNKSDQSMTFQIMYTSVNDYMIDVYPYEVYYYHELLAGCSTYIFMEFDADDLELSDITEVESIEFRFTLSNSDNTEDLLLDEFYTLNP